MRPPPGEVVWRPEQHGRGGEAAVHGGQIEAYLSRWGLFDELASIHVRSFVCGHVLNSLKTECGWMTAMHRGVLHCWWPRGGSARRLTS